LKIGDLVEVYRHLPRHEAGDCKVGFVGSGLIVELKETTPWTQLVTYISQDGRVKRVENGPTGGSSMITTVKVVSEGRGSG